MCRESRVLIGLHYWIAPGDRGKQLGFQGEILRRKTTIQTDTYMPDGSFESNDARLVTKVSFECSSVREEKKERTSCKLSLPGMCILGRQQKRNLLAAKKVNRVLGYAEGLV